MNKFTQIVAAISSHYPHLSIGDRLIIRQQAEEFSNMWKERTSEEAVASIATLEIFHARLEAYEIEIPVIASWIKDDTEMINEMLISHWKSPERR